VSKRREALSVKADTGKFTGLRAETPARRNSVKTVNHGDKDFVYGVLFVALLALGAKTPVNYTAKWFCWCTSDCEYFIDLTGIEGKDRSKTSIYHKFGCHLYLLQHDCTLKKTFHSNASLKIWNGTEKTKKKSEERELTKDKWYNQMGQVGTSWSRGPNGTRRRGDLSGTSEQGEGGLQIFVGQVGQGQGVCPLEPFHLSQMGLQDLGILRIQRF